MSYRPLSKRDVYDADLDTLHEAAMPWMVHPLIDWLKPFLWTNSGPGTANRSRTSFIEGFELSHREREPFSRKTAASAAHRVEARAGSDGRFAMDLVSYALSTLGGVEAMQAARRVVVLNTLLDRAGSAWQVSVDQLDDGSPRYTLVRRDLAAAKVAIADVEGKPGELLAQAWVSIARRDPDPRGGYDYAVKAVEAAMHGVVSPKNAKATLGTMIRDLRAKPGGWEFALGSVEPVIGMADTLWRAHPRHGTDGRPEPGLPEADAAVHLAIPLVRFFTGGLVTRAGGSS